MIQSETKIYLQSNEVQSNLENQKLKDAESRK